MFIYCCAIFKKKIVVTSIGFAFSMSLNFFQTIQFILWVVFVDFIGISLLVSTVFWIVINNFFVTSNNSSFHLIEEHNSTNNNSIEWGYSLDVHLNGFFSSICVLNLIQLPFMYCKS